jgi:ubiquitin carboxyl-terminal hydrolase 7
MEKINTELKFEETLDLDEIFDFAEADEDNPPPKKRNLYHLHSILMHRGTLNFGHYFAYIRPSATEPEWLEFNDESVTMCRTELALMQGTGGRLQYYQIENNKVY